MSDAEGLDHRRTAWLEGGTKAKMGHAALTTERLLFFDIKFEGAGAGALGAMIGGKLQKRHEEGGPLVNIALSEITALSHERKLMGKDRIRITTGADEYLFSDGWKAWSPLLRDTLTSKYGRRVVEESPDVWRVNPA